jgi:glycosyltransferase involved in cell wall biosynthesis
MKVVHFHRRPQPTQFSIEGYFSRIRSCLERAEKGDSGLGDCEIHVHMMPCFSSGISGRLRNILSAWWHQGDVNHITGDVQYIALLMHRKRTLLTVLDCQILERLTGWRRAVVKWLWFTLPATRVAAMTVISAETKRQLLREIRFPAERIHVVPVSVSEMFQPSPKSFNSDCPQILQVGTKANKNVPRLVQALKGLTCHLHIVGPVDESLKQMLADNGVTYTNYGRLTDEQIVERYREADIISFVSTYEGFGMPIVEAQCVERVCVTSNCSSMPEVAGDGAYLVDPFCVESIRAGFLRVIGDAPYREMLIERGRRNRHRFDEQMLAEQYAILYRQLGSGCH